jgi:hypothetical protein
MASVTPTVITIEHMWRRCCISCTPCFIMEALQKQVRQVSGQRQSKGMLNLGMFALTMACLFAAAVHDYENLGFTNDFLSKTGHA